MIRFTHGDIFAQPAEALVNPVNCVGVAGAGLALQFKRRHPDAFRAYRRACAHSRLRPGRMFMFDTGRDRPRWIVHFPTKRHWRDRSVIGDIEAGLRGLVATLASHGIRSIAIPPIGCGLGGLEWRAVRSLMAACLADLPATVIVLEPAPEAEPCARAGIRLREERETMTRDTTSIFASGAVIVPDIVTEPEERRILLRISQAPWMTDLSRRVQHYGYRYNYRGPTNGRQDPAPPFPRWASVIGERLSPFFDGALPEQCIVNEYRPGSRHRHARRPRLRSAPRRRVPLARRRLDHELPAPCGAPLRPGRAGVRRGRVAAPPLRPRPARSRQERLDARDRSRRQRAPGRHAHLCDLQDARPVITTAAFVRVEGNARRPAGRRRGERRRRG